MIKFFRKIRQQILTENKFSKYLIYAVGEIVLVVIGILIALQVNNWKNEINDSKTEHITLMQLKTDFENNDQLIENGIREHKDHLNNQIRTIKNTGPKVEMPDKSDLKEMYSMNWATIDLVFGSKNSNVSFDYINILDNIDLKRHISSFPSILIKYITNEDYNKEITIKQRELYSKYFSLASNDPSLAEHLNSAHTSKIIEWLEDRENQNYATIRYWTIKNFCLPELSRIRTQNQVIIDLIDSELRRFE